jgi:exodeoxyribonuclease VII small subunit
MAKKTTASFEQSLQELEKLVQKMDSGELSLEDSLIAFEKGIGLIRNCQTTLQTAEQKVQQLMEINGELHTQPFHEDDTE